MSVLRRQLTARATTVFFSSPRRLTFITPTRFTTSTFMSMSISTTASAFDAKYENIMTSRPAPRVALVTLNRPQALNALNMALIAELNEALHLIDADKDIGAIVITGSEKAFAGEHVCGCGVRALAEGLALVRRLGSFQTHILSLFSYRIQG